MTIQDELLKVIDHINAMEVEVRLYLGTAETLGREVDRLKRRVNELADIVRDFGASAEYAEAYGINTEPEK